MDLEQNVVSEDVSIKDVIKQKKNFKILWILILFLFLIGLVGIGYKYYEDFKKNKITEELRAKEEKYNLEQKNLAEVEDEILIQKEFKENTEERTKELYDKYMKYGGNITSEQIDGIDKEVLKKVSRIDDVVEEDFLKQFSLLSPITVGQQFDISKDKERISFKVSENVTLDVKCPLNPEPVYSVKHSNIYEECKMFLNDSYFENTTMSMDKEDKKVGKKIWTLQLYISNSKNLKFPFIVFNNFRNTFIYCNSSIAFLRDSEFIKYDVIHKPPSAGDGHQFCYKDIYVYREGEKEYILLYQYPEIKTVRGEVTSSIADINRKDYPEVETTAIRKFLVNHSKKTIIQTENILLVRKSQ